jgi:hypothetical protein
MRCQGIALTDTVSNIALQVGRKISFSYKRFGVQHWR